MLSLICSFVSRSGRPLMMVVALAAALVPASMLHADGENPLAQNNAAPGGGRITTEQLGQILDELNVGKNTITNNNFTYYNVNIPRGKYTFSINISLSPNGNVLWMNVPLNKIDPARVSVPALLNLLHKNNDIGPMFFELVGSKHIVNLAEPVFNRDLSTARFKGELDAFVQTLMDTEALWKQDTLAPAQGAEQAAPPANPLANPPSAPAPVNPLAHPPAAPVNPLAVPPPAPVNPLAK